MLSEKAKSKAQQRFFGMVRAAQKGEMENPSKEVSDVASDISMKDAKKFAKTKHKGLPEKKKMDEACWKGYKAYGVKKKAGKVVPNCKPVGSVKKEEVVVGEAKVDEKLPEYKRATARDKRYGNPHGSHELGGGIRKDRRADHEAKRGVKEEVVTEADKKGKGSGKKDACYHKVKASAKVWPSAYASGRLVQCRKKGAGSYGKSKSESYSWRDDVTEGSLHKWFNSSKSKDGKKGWVQSDGSPCANEPGETKTPKCYSSSKRASMSKKELRSADARKSRQDPNQQQKSGAAKPTYVATDKKESYEINPAAHKAAQKKTKMRNLAIGNANPNEKAAAEKKAGGPKLVGEGAAWTKKSGKNKEGGLNEKGRKSYERENPGSDLKAPQPEGGSRKKSFCARMGGMKKKLTSAKTANDPDSRINKSLRKWKCNEEKIEEVAFLAGLAKGAAVAAKGAVKQKAKEVVISKAANVAAGAIPQPNRDQQNESKGTAELAAIKLRGRKVCAECGSFAHVTGDCPKKEHPVIESNKYKGVLANPMKEAYRVLASSDGQEKPSQFSYKDEKVAKKYADSIKKGGGKATVTKESVLTKLGRKKKVEEKNPKKAMDAGARAKRLLQRKVHAKYVSGSQDLVPDDIRDHVEIATEAKVDKGRSDYGKATIRNWRHSGPSTVEPAMFDSENKRGKTIDKRREEHKSRRGVKGAKVPTYKKEELSIVDKMLIEFAPTFLVIEKKKQPSVHDDYYDPMEDPTFDPHEAEATRGQSGKGTKGKMNVRKKYPVKEGVVDVVKKGAKRHKDAVEKKKIKNRKAVPYAALAAENELEGEELKEYSPNVTYQAKGGKKSGKLGKSSVYSLRDKDESKKEFRKSQVKDIKGGYLKTEDYYSGTGEKVQKRTLAWMRKKGQKGAPGLDAMKERQKEHEEKQGVKKQ